MSAFTSISWQTGFLKSPNISLPACPQQSVPSSGRETASWFSSSGGSPWCVFILCFQNREIAAVNEDDCVPADLVRGLGRWTLESLRFTEILGNQEVEENLKASHQSNWKCFSFILAGIRMWAVFSHWQKKGWGKLEHSYCLQKSYVEKINLETLTFPLELKQITYFMPL